MIRLIQPLSLDKKFALNISFDSNSDLIIGILLFSDFCDFFLGSGLLTNKVVLYLLI